MSTPILTSKLYIPPPRPKIVLRPHLIQRLTAGLHHKLTLISAAAGFGKTALLSEWGAGCGRPVAWLSLDVADNEPTRFLAYVVAALQTVSPDIGKGVLAILHSPQRPAIESILTALLNEITTLSNPFILVLDDYHLIDAQPVDQILVFLLDHLPPQMHLVIATREDPPFPLARLRARGQLTELRAADLRFTPAEAAEFLNQVMRLGLSAADITALESRTEGWITGLQLAALALQGGGSMPKQPDAASFIQSFTGSHRFVLDYLVQEVLDQQPENIQTFLLRTSILDRLCGPLCDTLLLNSPASGQETLAHLERTNLFIIPLDNERRWYRYHHLFAELLRQRLHQAGNVGEVAELHGRASQWYEEHRLEIEAFHHATAVHDIERAERLIEGKGMPLLFRGGAAPILNWLKSLSTAVLDARPSLWVTYASALLFASQVAGVEQKLQAAEAALAEAARRGVEPDEKTNDLVGHIAAIRATMAVTQHQLEIIIVQSRRALEYLSPQNLPVRTATTWTLGYAYHLQGERTAARRAYTEALATSQAIGHFIITIMASLGLGNIQEVDNQLSSAAQTFQHVLQLAGDPPLPVVYEAHLGLARIFYQWNDLAAAQQHGQRSVELARQVENTDRLVACELFLARVKLAQGDLSGAAALLAKAEQSTYQHQFVNQMPEVTAVQLLILLHEGNLATAVPLAQTSPLPLSQARVCLAQGETAVALAVLAEWRQQVEAKGWADEQLKAMILQAVAYQAHGEMDTAVQLLGNALALAEPGGFIRLFVDEGLPMAELLSETAVRGIRPKYTGKLLAALAAEGLKSADNAYLPTTQSLIEPLSQRELEVLQLIAQGFSNREIGERLFLALDTVKGHNRRIYDKLDVQRRTEAIARARELGLL